MRVGLEGLRGEKKRKLRGTDNSVSMIIVGGGGCVEVQEGMGG